MSEQWSEIESLPPDVDMDALVINFNRQNINHKIVREDNVTRLWLKDMGDQALAMEIISQVQRMSTTTEQVAASRPPRELVVRAYIKRVPVTLAALLLCIVGTLLVKYFPDMHALLSFQNIIFENGRMVGLEPLSVAFEKNQWWRLITPAFLHFGLFHVVFNGLWLWEFGKRVELLTGSGAYIILLSALAIGSNVGQYLWAGPGLFGGFSGVVYGLLGYIWVRNKRQPDPLLALPPAIFPLMIGWLLICLFGVIDLFMQGGVANGAHLSGLVIGMIFGAFSGQRRAEVA